MEKGYLILENGRVFEGQRAGAIRDTIGELIFTTGMCGYIETLTDPSYFGQIITQTFPLMGNYGVMEEDFEGEASCFGYIAGEICDTPSNFRSQYSLNELLIRKNIPALTGIDTRDVVKVLRENGTRNAMIAGYIPSDLSAIKNYSVKDAVNMSGGKARTTIKSESAKYRVALMDFGALKSISNELTERNIDIEVFPHFASAEDILKSNVDGVILSNGAGDPSENAEIVKEIEKLTGNLPIFGIGLGHQLLCLAMGGKTQKLHFGHRGENQPVKDTSSGKILITNQNHGYTVDMDSANAIGRVSYINVNDMTCEGMDYKDYKAFSTQFYPDSEQYDRFIQLMEENKNAAN